MSPRIESSIAGRGGKAGRLEDRVYGELLAEIRSGSLRFGERLPSEKELATRFGVSRPVVRGALARLRDEALIVSKQGAGSFVNQGVAEGGGGFEPLNSIHDIEAYFRYRVLLEAETAALAATNAPAAGILLLRELVDEMTAVDQGGPNVFEADIAFHINVASMSDNRFLLESVKMLRPHMIHIGKFVRSLGRSGYAKGNREKAEEHLAIVAAIEAGESEAARRAMVDHIQGTQRRVFKGE